MHKNTICSYIINLKIYHYNYFIMNVIYTTSKLYRAFIEEEFDTISVQKEFDEKFANLGFINDRVLFFLTNYRSINYKKKTIHKYFELVFYFSYDILNDFVNFIRDTFIYKCRFLEKINNFTQIQDVIKELCMTKILTNRRVKYFNEHVFIDKLNLSNNNNKIDCIKQLTQLTHLYLSNNRKVLNNDLHSLTNLTHLDISNNDKIGDYGFHNLSNLQYLKANYKITEKSINSLRNLRYLNLCESDIGTKCDFKSLENLVYLNIGKMMIKLESIKKLLNLQYLIYDSNIGYIDDKFNDMMDDYKNLNPHAKNFKMLDHCDPNDNILKSIFSDA